MISELQLHRGTNKTILNACNNNLINKHILILYIIFIKNEQT